MDDLDDQTPGVFPNPWGLHLLVRIKTVEEQRETPEVTSDAYFIHLIPYIHRNPQRHGFVAGFRDWSYSSYRAILSTKPSRLKRDELLAWFDIPTNFEASHQHEADLQEVPHLIVDDLDDQTPGVFPNPWGLHLLVRIKTVEEQRETPEVTSDAYFIHLIPYIHRNPQRHGFVAGFRDWSYSSYRAILSTKPSRLKRDEALAWFDCPANSEAFHQHQAELRENPHLIADDLDD